MLKARLYQLEKSKREKEAYRLYNEKGEISWGNQIRSYILDDSRVKDHRTNIETFNPTAVLNGDIDIFIENYHRWRKTMSQRKSK
jgi:peptide chain release factor 2